MNHNQTNGLAIGRAAPVNAEQPREREIPDVLGQLQGAVDSAHATLGLLIGRINPVMRAPNPAAAGASVEVPAYTDLGNSLHNLLQSVRALESVAADALGRLELS